LYFSSTPFSVERKKDGALYFTAPYDQWPILPVTRILDPDTSLTESKSFKPVVIGCCRSIIFTLKGSVRSAQVLVNGRWPPYSQTYPMSLRQRGENSKALKQRE